MELRARQRIGHGDADVVRPRAAHEIARRDEIVPLLAGIAELQEPAGANALRLQRGGRSQHFFHGRALVHRVQDALRAGFDAHPDLLAPRAREGPRDVRRDEVGAALDHEGDARVARLDRVGQLGDPPRGEAEQVVGEPDVLDADLELEPAQLLGHRRGRPLRVAAAEHRLRAPVAAVRAAARSRDVP